MHCSLFIIPYDLGLDGYLDAKHTITSPPHTILSPLSPPSLPSHFIISPLSLFPSTLFPYSLFIIPYDLGLDGYLDAKQCKNRRRCTDGHPEAVEKVVLSMPYFNRYQGT